MSELIQNSHQHTEALLDFTRRLILGENGKALIEKHKHIIETVTPTDTMLVLDRMLQEGFSTETVKANVGKIINVFFKSLQAFEWTKPGEGHFLYYLMLENREVEKIMSEIKGLIKTLFKTPASNLPETTDQLRLQVLRLKEYELHYIKKENILFPFMEKTFSQYRCLKIMWSFHDDFRQSLKTLETILKPASPDIDLLNKELGKLFFVVLPILFREEQIVFPVALRAIPEKDWEEMLAQSSDTGWCYIPQPTAKIRTIQKPNDLEGKIDLGTGFLDPSQLMLLLNHLPVDITFVDENDEVRYFSGATHRIFPRSKAIIGRKVQNCHPPESVHVVNEIVDTFRQGRKSHADFWLTIKSRFIHIRYFALRNEAGEYKGTIEVSQDVTEIRELKGEQRLLDWNNPAALD